MSIRKTIFSLMIVLVMAAAPAMAQSDNAASRQPLVSLPSFAPVVEKAEAAVVNISAMKLVKSRSMQRSPFGPGPEGDLFDRFFGDRLPRQEGGKERKEHSLGTGFIIDPAGFVITNNHVIEGAEDIKIKLSSGEEIKAEIIGRDPKTDLALLKLQKEMKYPYLALGDSDQIKIGDWVVAIGNPFGLDHTVTAGILSARGRSIGAGPYDDFLQFDASINFGNSGGPLLSVYGEVIGINAMIVSSGGGGNVGIGFAIPSKLAKGVVEQLKDKGRVVRGWIGVVIQKVSPDMAKSFSLGEARGALISDIDPDGPSEGKLQRGDIILSFDGKDIKEMQDLPLIVANTDVGKKVKVQVFRDKKEITLELTVAEMKEDIADSSTPGTDSAKLGLTLRSITPELAARNNLSEKDGLYIAGLEAGSPAAEAGLNMGDVVMEIDNKPIKNRGDYTKAVAGKKGGDILRFLVKRGGNTMFFTVAIDE